jgi:hypothetical protein
MMALRLVELHRVLKETASPYLHCDPTASHYDDGKHEKRVKIRAVYGS